MFFDFLKSLLTDKNIKKFGIMDKFQAKKLMVVSTSECNFFIWEIWEIIIFWLFLL